MLLITALQILNKRVKNKDYRDILKEFKSHCISADFDIENEKIDSDNTLDIFANFCDFWISQELSKNEIRNFKRCMILNSIFQILTKSKSDFNHQYYVSSVSKMYKEKYSEVVKNITKDISYFIDKKDDLKNGNNDFNF